MHDLEITWPGGVARFTPSDSPVRVGRSSEAAIPLTEGSVSRRHLELVWGGSDWTANDGSTHGTFDTAGTRLGTQWVVDSDRSVRLGGLGGVELQIRLQGNGAVGGNGAAASASAPGGLFSAGNEPPVASDASPVAGTPGLFDDKAAPPPPAPSAPEPAVESTGILDGIPAAPSFDAPAPEMPAAPAADLPSLDPPSFDAPAAPSFGTPDAPSFDAPAAPSFETPDAPSFDAASLNTPVAPSLDASDAPSFDAPAAPSFDTPDAPSLDAPAAPSVGVPDTPAAPSFDAPAAPSFGTPDAPSFDAPAAASFETPSFETPSFDAPSPEAPAGPSFDAPSFESPAAPSFDSPAPASPDVPAPPPVSAFDAPPAPPGANPQAAPPAPGGFGSPEAAPPAPPPAAGGPPDPSGFGAAAPAPAPSAPALNPSDTIISDATLRINVDGQDFSFLPGAEVTVGRDPSCLVQLDEKHSLVSRRHLRISFRDNNWWLEDFSSKGTFVDNKPIKGAYKAEGAFIANLGDDDAGTPMRVITSGEHRVPKGRNGLAIAALAAALIIPLAALGFILARGSGSADATEPDFASAKQATVMLFGEEGGQGSGFFVSDNLIVTNQHVAALSPQMWVAVSRSADEPAQIEYATELVQNHPFLDIAVLRVTNRAQLTDNGPIADPGPVGDINIQAVTIGDSNDITLGDPVFSTGFPGRLSITSADDMGDLRLPPVSATSGEAASFSIWPGCSNPDFESFIPAESPPGVTCSGGGDVNKGVLVSTFSSGQGASGSAVFRNNEVVAVVFAGSVDEANASLNITTTAFGDWLQEIIDAQG